MPYIKMPTWKYCTLTLALYIVCILGALFVNDLAAIFNFIGAFGLALTSFGLPGIFYLKLLNNEKAFVELETEKERKCNKIGAITGIVLCLLNIFIVLTKTIV